ncbi:MAG: peptidylprolyl isomerase [Candidatus Tectomicrobia bacterium]
MSESNDISYIRRVGTYLRGEPLAHFIALAALLFAFDHVWSSAQKEKIIVDQQTVDFLVKQQEDLVLRKLTPEERQQVIDGYIEDEILYREAYKRGLDKNTRMRRNLILKMRGLALGDIKKPTDEELKRFFEANRARYARPPTLSLIQVFYRDPSKVPEGLLEQLRAGRDPKTVGEYLNGYGRSLSRVATRELVGMLGPEAARPIVALQDNQWHGPFESIRGTHFVRIVERRPPREVSYEEVKAYLEQERMMAQSRNAIEKEVEKVRKDYDIVVETKGMRP